MFCTERFIKKPDRYLSCSEHMQNYAQRGQLDFARIEFKCYLLIMYMLSTSRSIHPIVDVVNDQCLSDVTRMSENIPLLVSFRMFNLNFE